MKGLDCSMLEPRQIKKLAKPKTDNQISKGDVKSSAGYWTDGFILFCEPYPSKLKAEPVDLPGTTIRWLSNYFLHATTAVYPVELRGWDGLTALSFSDGEETTWFDANYVSAFVRRAGKSPVHYIRGKVGNDPYIAVHNGHVLGLLMGLSKLPKGEPEWNFAYTGPLPERGTNELQDSGRATLP